jgi:hypothetical protein
MSCSKFQVGCKMALHNSYNYYLVRQKLTIPWYFIPFAQHIRNLPSPMK